MGRGSGEDDKQKEIMNGWNKMDKPKVSVIIPAYNVEDYIDKAINSILEQTYENVELIVVNDGSTDNTLKVISAYSNIKNVKILTQKNAGVSKARNRGIEHATGEYCVFLDGDDWVDKRLIEKMIDAVISYRNDGNEGTFLLAENCHFIMTDGKNQDNRITKANAGLENCIISSKEALLETGTSKYILQSVWCKLFSVQVIRENNLQFDSNYSNGEDGLFTFRYLMSVDEFIYVNHKDWYILVRNGSVTRSGFNLRLNTGIQAIDAMIDLTQEVKLRNALKIYMVEKAISLESKCVQSKDSTEEELKIYRTILLRNKDIYFSVATGKKRIIWYIMEYMPKRIIKIVLALKGNC